LDRLEPDDCVPILHQTSNLVHCELILFDWEYDDSNPPVDLPLPCLESLTLKNRQGSGPLLGYLHTFVVPALRSLRIPESWLEPNPIASLASFMSKSSCKLQDLHIAEIFGPGTIAYRKAFPSIQKVSFGIRSANWAADIAGNASPEV
jgi:hypothetical protein